ncbi:MAG TPA: response regulator, partial [Byssovorax sp.]
MTKVLVFESDPKFAGELRSELGRLGCTVQVVDDGNVGLQTAASDRPDLILLSIELPRMNGFSVCNKLKKDAALKDVPLIIMSSESSDETFEQHKKLRTRAEDYVHKPIAFGDLLGHIRPFVSTPTMPPDSEAIALDEVEVEEPSPPPPPKPRAPTAAPPPLPAAANAPRREAKVDTEIEDFIGGAFDHLIADDEAARKAARPQTAPPAPQTSPPVGRSAPPPGRARNLGSIAPPSPSVPPPPVTDAAAAAYRAIQIPPPDNGEADRVRAELDHAKSEIVKLTKDAANAHGAAARSEQELEANRDEIARLKRDVEDAKRAGGGKPGAVSSREFLDLREALNKKDKEILGMRDQLSRKDKELLDVRDQSLVLEREKADQSDKLLDLERAKDELTSQVDSLRADRELAAKRADD